MGGGEAWETGWPDLVRDHMLGMESRMTARLLAIQEENQFGDTVDWVIVRSQKLRLAAVTIWIQCCRKQGCFVPLSWSPMFQHSSVVSVAHSSFKTKFNDQLL